MGEDIKPKVSIITATHFRPDLLYRCIAAIQHQQLVDYEHLIISDHCPFAQDIYIKFASDDRIRFLQVMAPHRRNYGAVAKNIGMRQARADFICYCDDDNILLPEHTRVLYDAIMKREVDVVYSGMYHINVTRKGNGSTKWILKQELFQNSRQHLACNLHDAITMIHRRDLGVKVGWRVGTPDAPGEDGDFMRRMHKETPKVATLATPSAVYYGRHACTEPDRDYLSRLHALPPRDILVYPELRIKEEEHAAVP